MQTRIPSPAEQLQNLRNHMFGSKIVVTGSTRNGSRFSGVLSGILPDRVIIHTDDQDLQLAPSEIVDLSHNFVRPPGFVSV